MRIFVGLLAGIIAGILAMVLVAFIGGLFFQLPIDAAYQGARAQAAHAVAEMPLGARLFVVLAWFVGGLAGSAVTRLVTGSVAVGWVAAGLLAVITLINIFLLPMAAWMQIATVAMPLLGGLAGAHLPAPRGRAW